MKREYSIRSGLTILPGFKALTVRSNNCLI